MPKHTTDLNAECRHVKVRSGSKTQNKMLCVHRQDIKSATHTRHHLQPGKVHKKYDPSRLSPGLEVAQANGLPIDPRKNMVQWGNKWIPTCDASGFPYVQGCYHDMSNWTSPGAGGGPKQCYAYNPGNTSLNSGSIYTCGFLW